MPDSLTIAQHYHERTKYTPERLAVKTQPLEWSEQPSPFKTYKFGVTYDLKPYLTNERAAVGTAEWGWQRLSWVLYCSYGLTVKVTSLSGEPIYLRSAPSAGGLYPAEVYLISRGTHLLPAGLYHYQPQSHTLLRFWENEVWQGLQDACFWHPTLDHTQLALVTTAIFFRSAWRYKDRAYRRICLDTGHLLGNIELVCSVHDYRPHLIGGFVDDGLNQLLYLEPDKEGAIAVLALADLLDVGQNLPVISASLPSTTTVNYPDIADGKLLSYLHQATQIPPGATFNYAAITKPADTTEPVSEPQDKYNFPFCRKVSTVTPPIDWGMGLEGLETTLINRRSTRTFSGADLNSDDLNRILDFTYQPQHYIDQNLDRVPDYFDLELIQTFIAISGVEGLEEGCYYYAPHAEELRQIRFKNFRRELHRLCLGQDLGRDAGALIFHTADLSQAIERYGDRAYRYLHMDAGHLGQRLNLAAIYLGLGVSGIGGFFDDEVNEVLGIPADEAVLYITTLGVPRR